MGSWQLSSLPACLSTSNAAAVPRLVLLVLFILGVAFCSQYLVSACAVLNPAPKCQLLSTHAFTGGLEF